MPQFLWSVRLMPLGMVPLHSQRVVQPYFSFNLSCCRPLLLSFLLTLAGWLFKMLHTAANVKVFLLALFITYFTYTDCLVWCTIHIYLYFVYIPHIDSGHPAMPHTCTRPCKPSDWTNALPAGAYLPLHTSCCSRLNLSTLPYP